jgi:hypothetical protein
MMPASTRENPKGRTTERIASETASGDAARSTAAMNQRVSSKLRRDIPNTRGFSSEAATCEN